MWRKQAAFTTSTTFAVRTKSEPEHACMCASSTQRTSKVSRRTMILAALSCTTPSAVLAYSSPYKPSENESKPLPERLYDAKARSTVKLPSGLEYFDLTVGGGEEAKRNSQVWIYYTTRLRGLNGIKLDSSYDEKLPSAFSFRVGEDNVVEGLSELVEGMQVGGKRRGVLPPQIAYRSVEQRPVVRDFFAKRRLLSVLETKRDATIVFE